MNLYDIFTFGKYKGLTLNDVYQGKDNISRDLVKNYLIYSIESEIQFINSTLTVIDFSDFCENENNNKNILKEEAKTIRFRDRR